MFEELKIGAWASIDSRCPIRLLAAPEDEGATLIFGDHDTFELHLDVASLQSLVELGTETLHRLTE
ncbi:hypothetical protein [Nocardia sp. NPDC051463]|uniref:hypothetical protein n=1 Tax=Nocardia sp. NPDC051463 TaxID=3154845 RepID=UPI00341F63FE